MYATCPPQMYVYNVKPNGEFVCRISHESDPNEVWVEYETYGHIECRRGETAYAVTLTTIGCRKA